MELQPFAQPNGDALAIGIDGVALGHLRLGLVVLGEAVERVPHREAVHARDIGRGDDRIERGKIRLRHEAQQLRGVRGPLPQRGPPRQTAKRGGGDAGEKVASLHAVLRAIAVRCRLRERQPLRQCG